MVKRKIILIDEDKCNGCGQCIPNCHEGALIMIDNKARLISDLFCDGLGACIGHCPQGAITIEEREAEKYDERRVMEEHIIPKGVNTIKAHLEHMRDHNETEYLNEAFEILKEHNIENPLKNIESSDDKCSGSDLSDDSDVEGMQCGCSGSMTRDFSEDKCDDSIEESGKRKSQLRQWPVQLHLLSPMASYFRNADVLLAADCVGFSIGDFHKDFLKDKALAIACPKLDSNQEIYLEKMVSLIDDANINTLTVMIMEVPCCGGLIGMAQEALEKATRKIPIKLIVVGIKGDIVEEKWV